MKLTGELEGKEFLAAFEALDKKLPKPVKMLMGGGAAMILAHGFALATFDVDAIPYQTSLPLGEIDKFAKEVAHEKHFSPHWMNPYFSNFTYVLPSDYQKRLIKVFQGEKLEIYALSKMDLLILKCFAGREKDIGHTQALMKNMNVKELKTVESHIETLLEKKIPGTQKALDFLYEIKEMLGK